MVERGLRLQDTFEPCNQHRQVFLHGLPNDIEVDVEVCVNVSISHSDDSLARDFRRLRSSRLGYLAGSFTYDLDIFDQR